MGQSCKLGSRPRCQPPPPDSEYECLSKLNLLPLKYHREIKKVLQINCKTQLMERDTLNQQHVTQCYAIALIKSHRSLLVVGKSTG